MAVDAATLGLVRNPIGTRVPDDIDPEIVPPSFPSLRRRYEVESMDPSGGCRPEVERGS
jgi:hypothetical protein